MQSLDESCNTRANENRNEQAILQINIKPAQKTQFLTTEMMKGPDGKGDFWRTKLAEIFQLKVVKRLKKTPKKQTANDNRDFK